MLFYTYQQCHGQNDSSAMVELQFCRLPVGTVISELTVVSHIRHFQTDSLYVSEESVFYREYCHIFNCGIYNNSQCGTVDLYGINYYPPTTIDNLIEKLCNDKPTDYKILTAWLQTAKQYNGFYILGI